MFVAPDGPFILHLRTKRQYSRIEVLRKRSKTHVNTTKPNIQQTEKIQNTKKKQCNEKQKATKPLTYPVAEARLPGAITCSNLWVSPSHYLTSGYAQNMEYASFSHSTPCLTWCSCTAPRVRDKKRTPHHTPKKVK